jgi:environmental stress-induced protein Ves
MANVATGGAFSRFDGVDRQLLILQGEGLELRFDQEDSFRLTSESIPLEFCGERAVNCRLLGGPVTDFNVMTRRGRYRQTVQRVTLSPRQDVCGDASLNLFLLLDAEVELDHCGKQFKLMQYDAIVVQQGERFRLQSTLPCRFLQLNLDAVCRLIP